MTIRPDSVLITGASSGIGAACALHLAARGFRVYAGVRNPAHGDALLAQSPSNLVPLRIDVADPASIESAADTVLRAEGGRGLGGLVNNAGIAVGGPLEVLPLSELRRQFEVNVIGAMAVTQAVLPLLRTARGRIVNMGSIAGRISLPSMGSYSMSKSALGAMTATLRLELDRWGIEVSIVEPGAIATPIWQKSTAAADALEPTIRSELLSLYRDHIISVRRMVAGAQRHANPVDAVVAAVTHALTAARPRTHYLVGADARVRTVLAMLLPQRVHDAFYRWYLGLPPRQR